MTSKILYAGNPIFNNLYDVILAKYTSSDRSRTNKSVNNTGYELKDEGLDLASLLSVTITEDNSEQNWYTHYIKGNFEQTLYSDYNFKLAFSKSFLNLKETEDGRLEIVNDYDYYNKNQANIDATKLTLTFHNRNSETKIDVINIHFRVTIDSSKNVTTSNRGYIDFSKTGNAYNSFTFFNRYSFNQSQNDLVKYFTIRYDNSRAVNRCTIYENNEVINTYTNDNYMHYNENTVSDLIKQVAIYNPHFKIDSVVLYTGDFLGPLDVKPFSVEANGRDKETIESLNKYLSVINTRYPEYNYDIYNVERVNTDTPHGYLNIKRLNLKHNYAVDNDVSLKIKTEDFTKIKQVASENRLLFINYDTVFDAIKSDRYSDIVISSGFGSKKTNTKFRIVKFNFKNNTSSPTEVEYVSHSKACVFSHNVTPENKQELLDSDGTFLTYNKYLTEADNDDKPLYTY